MNRVNIDTPSIEFTTEGYSSQFSKEYEEIQHEIDVFYTFFEKDDELPVTIFSQDLSPLQAIVSYLKKEGLSYSEIARRINRDPRTVWATFDAIKDEVLKELPTRTFVPLDIFRNRDLSTLESLVKYLLEQEISIKDTAVLLQKDYQTIWTIKQRIKKKEVSYE